MAALLDPGFYRLSIPTVIPAVLGRERSAPPLYLTREFRDLLPGLTCIGVLLAFVMKVFVSIEARRIMPSLREAVAVVPDWKFYD